jgi:hypothetical protein
MMITTTTIAKIRAPICTLFIANSANGITLASRTARIAGIMGLFARPSLGHESCSTLNRFFLVQPASSYCKFL